MGLADLRGAVFAQVDWAPSQSTEAKARVNAFINRAYRLLATDAPFAFFEDELTFSTQADFVPSVTGDTVSSSLTDTWVLVRDITEVAAGDDAWPYPVGLQTALDNTPWIGRMIELYDGTDYVRRRIRDMWADGGLGYMTLDKPLGNNIANTANLSYRVYTSTYYLPGDVQEIQSLRMYRQNESSPLKPLGKEQAEKLSFLDTPSSVSAGRPRNWFRRPEFRMQAPTRAPELSAAVDLWAGDEPGGTFQYVFTYAWGYQDPDFNAYGPDTSIVKPGGKLQLLPLWESPPSPVSTVGTGEQGAVGIRITTPDINYMQGFGEATSTRYLHSGWRKRIYRRRLTVAGAVGAITIESPDTYYLLDDINGTVTEFDDLGGSLPHYEHPLRSNHGYFGLSFYPRPDGRYPIDVRAITSPSPLVDDQDAPRVHIEAEDAIINRALMLLYESEGNGPMMQLAESRYEKNLRLLSKRYGLDTPSSTVGNRLPANTRSNSRSRRKWW